jgi:T3SS negative regulator,GrlR
MIDHCSMKPEHFRFALATLEITQADFARLIEVTPRAISMWLGGERSIPGSVEAYLRLLNSLTTTQLLTELARLNKGIITMKDGMYGIQFAGAVGTGMGMLVFENGRIYGADEGHGKYDGTYVANPSSGMVDVNIRVQMPANRTSVVGLNNPYDWILEVSTEMDPIKDAGQLDVRHKMGAPIKASYEFLRSLPSE